MKLYALGVRSTEVLRGIALLFFGYHSSWTLQHIAGAVLVVIGAVGWLIATVQLGSNFTPRAEARALVTQGLYSKIRNPIYFFGGVLILGITLYLSSPWWVPLVLAVVLVPLQVRRAKIEARVLEAKFGDAYRRYRRKTWF